MAERKRLGPKDRPQPRRARKALFDDGQWARGAAEERGAEQPTGQTAYEHASSARDEEPVDTDFHESLGDRARGQWRRTRQRAREYFGSDTRARMDDHEKAHRTEEARAADEDPQMTQRDQLLKLRAQTRLAGEQYMASLRESNVLAPGFNDDEREQGDRLDAMREVYTQMMIQSCVRPLSRGVNGQSVIQAVGMMTAMTMLSKNFRSEVGQHLEPIKEKIQKRIDNKARGQVERASTDIERRQQLFGGIKNERRRDRKIGDPDPRRHLSTKWQRRFDDLERRERGNREMYTPESAAMTEIGLMENAFWKLREPGADQVQIKKSYKAMLTHVRGQFDDDGLDRNDVVGRIKLLMGTRLEHEPELASMYVGMAHGYLDRDHTVDAETGQRQWNGEFRTCTGVRVPDDGMFAVRMPMGVEGHSRAMTETMRSSLSHAMAREDPQGLKDGVMGYMAAFAGQKQGMDSSGSPSARRAETMMASMEADGLDVEQQRQAYSMAYANAMDGVGQEHPRFEQALSTTLGPEWRQKLQEAVDDPAVFMARESTRSRPYQAGPAPGPGTSQAQPEGDYQPA